MPCRAIGPLPVRLTAAIAVAVLHAALTAAPASAACGAAPLVSGPQTLDVAGLRRSFVVRAPAGSDGSTRAPVVFAFHPFGMSAGYMQTRAPIGRAWPEAVVVYPDGAPRGADSPAPAWQGRAGELGDRDLQFFDAMLAWLETRGCIDRGRVFVLGYSNGAGLTHLLACARRTAVAGAAVIAGRLSCEPSGAVPVLVSHGLRDGTAPYGAGVEASARWAAANRCTAPPTSGVLGCAAAPGCASAVTLCTYAGGHEYDPAFTRAAAEFFKGAR